jgi:anaerobic ribonucleoside-triphosphate reductase activating protein
MSFLNIAEICPKTRTLGPGQRFVIWVQGCCFRCEGCVSPDWIPDKQRNIVHVEKLVELISSIPDIDGLTFSGGEPMLQAAALAELFTGLRQRRDLSIMCFSGFTLPQLRSKSNPHIDKVLDLIDVLVDGLYIPRLNDNKGWRGSSNQVVHHLSTRHLHESHLFTERKRDIEIHMGDEAALVVGVPPLNFSDTFKQATGHYRFEG